MAIKARTVINTDTSATLIGLIDTVLNDDGTLTLVFHRITAAGQANVSTEYAIDDLGAVLSHLRDNESDLHSVTFSKNVFGTGHHHTST